MAHLMRRRTNTNWKRNFIHSERSDRKPSVFFKNMFLFALVSHFLFIPIFYMLGNPVTFIDNILAVFLDLLCLSLNHKKFAGTASFIWIFGIAAHTSVCLLVFGWDQGYSYYLLGLVPIVFFTPWPKYLQLIVSFCLFTATLFLYYDSYAHLPITETSEGMALFMYFSNAAANFIGLTYASFYYRRHSERLARQLSFLAHTDTLTGIYNRGFFERSAQSKLNTQSGECALILFDIDHFKRINDTFGHPAGDRALQKVVEICRQNLRAEDLFGRIGGEEFAVLLPNTDQQTAIYLAEQLREHVALHRIKLDNGKQVNLSISIGVIHSSLGSLELSQLMVRADQALYQAKKSGRNNVAQFNEGKT